MIENPLDIFNPRPEWPEAALAKRAVLLSQILEHQENGRSCYIVCGVSQASYCVASTADAENELWEAFKGSQGRIDSLSISTESSGVTFSGCYFENRTIYDRAELLQLPEDQQEILRCRESFILATGISPSSISNVVELESAIQNRLRKVGATWALYKDYLDQLDATTSDSVVREIVIPYAREGALHIKSAARKALGRMERFSELHEIERSEDHGAFEAFCSLTGRSDTSGIRTLVDLDRALAGLSTSDRNRAETAFFDSLTTLDATEDIVENILHAAHYERGAKPGPHQGLWRKHLALQALHRLDLPTRPEDH